MSRKLRPISRIALAIAAFANLAPPAVAQSPSDVVEAQILSGWQEPDGQRVSGLQLRLAPGWKTYWRVPGDAGIPPQFDWSGSRNLAGVTVQWPRPEIHDINGMRSIGYSGTVVLPLQIEANDPNQPVRLSAEIAMGVCESICIPVTITVTGQLAGAGRFDARIDDAIRTRPRRADGGGQQQVTCAVSPIRDGMALRATINLPQLGGDEAVVIEPSDPRIWVSEPITNRSGNLLEAEAELVPPSAKPFALDRSTVRFTVIGASDAVEIMGCKAGR